MRIAIVNWRDTSHPQAGGAEVVVRKQCEGLTHRGHSVTLFTATFPGGVRRERVGGFEVIRIGGRFSQFFQIPRLLSSATNRMRFDVLLEHINGVPYWSPVWFEGPTVAMAYHIVGRTFFEELPFPLSAIGYTMERAIPLAYGETQMICLGSGAKSQFARIGIPLDNLHVIPPGIDHRVYRPCGQKSANPSAMMLGPIKHYKNHEFVIRCVPSLSRYLPGFELVIVGRSRNGLESYLMRVANECGVADSVHFAGYVGETEKVELLRKSWIVVYASEREGWGLGISEAAACGSIAVGPRLSGILDSITDGVTGFIYSPGDSSDFVDKITRVCSDSGLRAQMELAATNAASKQSWEEHVDQLERILEGAACP